MSHWQDWLAFLLEQVEVPQPKVFPEDQLALSFESGDQFVFENNTDHCLISLRLSMNSYKVEEAMIKLLKRSDPLAQHKYQIRFGYTGNLGFVITIPLAYVDYQKEEFLEAFDELWMLKEEII